MAPVRNARAVFNSIPDGYPDANTIIYDDSNNIDLENVPLNGGVLVKTLVLSIDPYMRGRMRPPTVASYNQPFTLGQPLDGHGVGVVLRSEIPEVKPGVHLYGRFVHQEYNVFPSLQGLRVIENKEGLPWSAYVGAAGMPGQTAYVAWQEFSRSKRGETAFVTTGGGPVGSFVIQLAKLDGLKVIASAGSDEKVQFMKNIGADVAFNYKTTSTAEVLKKEGPIDIFWDNVGGETLDLALEAANVGARFIECGMISVYNATKNRYPIQNLFMVVPKSISINGFIIFNLLAKYEEDFYAEVPAKLAKGEIKYSEDVTKGLDKVPDVMIAVQRGTNKGKAVIQVAEE